MAGSREVVAQAAWRDGPHHPPLSRASWVDPRPGCLYEPEAEPDPAGGAPDAPAGGAACEPELELEPEPLPMFGHFWVEPLPELELELEPDVPELEPDELAPEFEPEPEPVLELVFELLDVDGVVVDALVLALEPVEPVLLVVAASATSAPPATRPVVSAPIAKTLRNRTFMVVALSFRVLRHTRSGRQSHAAPRICG